LTIVMFSYSVLASDRRKEKSALRGMPYFRFSIGTGSIESANSKRNILE
jgi:hypothetical protein